MPNKKDDNTKPVYQQILERIEKGKASFNSSDNISEFIENDELPLLVGEVAEAYKEFLKRLIIDVENDANSKGTAKRVAKMYITELMKGRFFPLDEMTSFPNIEDYIDEDGDVCERQIYEGMVLTRVPIQSMCSHHHLLVHGEAFIGVLPESTVLGLSKFARIADWVARRGILQEMVTRDIAELISEISECDHIAVYVEAHHGCCECRGIKIANSKTSTACLLGTFYTDQKAREEFYAQINLSKMGDRR